MATPRTTLAVAWLSIFVIGMVSGVLGPLLPILALRLALPVEALGSLFTALFIGALAAQASGGWLGERFGLRRLVLAGALLMAFGILGLAASPSLPLLLAAAALVGLGQGTLDISTNVLVTSVYPPERVVSAVNLLHFAFGAGAVLSPVVASATVARWGTPMPALWLAAAAGLATAALGVRRLLDPPVAAHHATAPGAAALYRSPALWLLALILFLYVGGEMGVGGWTTVYLARTSALSERAIALVVSAYWLALTAGRLLGAVLGARIRGGPLLFASLVGSCGGALLLVAGGGSVTVVVAGTLLLGLAYGPIFPTTVVMATERFPRAPGRAVSVLVAVSSLGGMALPPLQGILLERVGPLAGQGLVAAGAAGMLVALLAVRGGDAER